MGDPQSSSVPCSTLNVSLAKTWYEHILRRYYYQYLDRQNTPSALPDIMYF